MKITLKVLLISILITGLFAVNTANAATDSKKCMNDATTQYAMNVCADQDYTNSDQELNQIYHALQVKYKNNPSFLNKLKESEQAWVKFRDAELAMMYPPQAVQPGDNTNSDYRAYYGSVYPMCASTYLTELTNDRIAQLKKWLGVQTEGDVCNGSIGDTNPISS